ncbi:hypothetical protein WA171_005338 [Blastocystis sp. BT1]
MANQEEKESVSPIVRIIMELLSPGANRASLLLLNGTLILIWILILVSLFFHYYNIHVYITGILTTCLVIFVNYFSIKINSVIPKEDEEKED